MREVTATHANQDLRRRLVDGRFPSRSNRLHDRRDQFESEPADEHKSKHDDEQEFVERRHACTSMACQSGFGDRLLVDAARVPTFVMIFSRRALEITLPHARPSGG